MLQLTDDPPRSLFNGDLGTCHSEMLTVVWETMNELPKSEWPNREQFTALMRELWASWREYA